jgi:hypothetical protein
MSVTPLRLTALALWVWVAYPGRFRPLTSPATGITDGYTITVLNHGVEERIPFEGQRKSPLLDLMSAQVNGGGSRVDRVYHSLLSPVSGPVCR